LRERDMKEITNIGQYWTIHKWHQVGLLEIEKMTRKIDNLMDKRSKMDRSLRKPLSDQIVALRHDRARSQGKGMKMDKALKAYTNDYPKEDLNPWDLAMRKIRHIWKPCAK